MGFYNNAALVEDLSGIKTGHVRVGDKADLILVDYEPFTPLSAGNLPWHIVFGFRDSMVTTTIVDGKVLMHDREIVIVDEEKVLHEARKLAPDVWSRFEEQYN
jgi:cytosine/adenosine deaminase-related metal-dependent hydrolase